MWLFSDRLPAADSLNTRCADQKLMAGAARIERIVIVGRGQRIDGSDPNEYGLPEHGLNIAKYLPEHGLNIAKYLDGLVWLSSD